MSFYLVSTSFELFIPTCTQTHRKCNAVPGELLSKFTTPEKPRCGYGFVMQCQNVQIFSNHALCKKCFEVITVLYNKLHDNKSLLIDNLPSNHNFCERE